MQSVCSRSEQSTKSDIIASNKDYIEKMGERWMAIADYYKVESNSYHSSAQKKPNEVNDSLDVCNYRIIQNYAVNKVPMSNHDYVRGAASKESSSFNLSDSVSFQFMDQSADDLAISNMEDTLDVCNYRRSVRNNLPNILSDQDSTLDYNDVIAEYSFNNKSISDAEHMKPNESTDKIEDTLDVCYYRQQLAKQSLTPERHAPWMSLHFNRLTVPFSFLSPSPIQPANASIVSSSSISNSSSLMSQFSDQSDDYY